MEIITGIYVEFELLFDEIRENGILNKRKETFQGQSKFSGKE